MVGLELLFVEFFGINGAPGVDDIGEHERYQKRYPEHRGQRELTRAGVLDGQ